MKVPKKTKTVVVHVVCVFVVLFWCGLKIEITLVKASSQALVIKHLPSQGSRDGVLDPHSECGKRMARMGKDGHGDGNQRALQRKNALEYKFPAHRRFPQLWQSLPLMCAPRAYCAYDGAPPAFSSEQTKLSLQDRRAGSLDDDNSAPGQDPLPTILRDEPILALQDASERDKGLMWQDDDLPPSSDVCTRVLTANVCHPNVGDTLPAAAEQPKMVEKLKTHDKIG